MDGLSTPPKKTEALPGITLRLLNASWILVKLINNFINIRRLIAPDFFDKQKETPLKKRKTPRPSKSSGILEVWLLLIIITTMVSLPWILFCSLFLTLLALDPYYYLLNAIMASFLSQHWFLFGLTRFLLSFLTLFVFIRLCLVILYISTALVCISKKPTASTFIRARMSTDLLLEIYGIITLQLAALERFLNPIVTVEVTMLQIFGIFGFFSTIGMRPPVIPFPFYFLCPLTLVAAFLLFYIFLTPACSSYELVLNFQRELKRRPLAISKGKPRKILAMRIASLRIISANAGLFDYRFFPLRKSTKGTFLENMISFTITLLLDSNLRLDK